MTGPTPLDPDREALVGLIERLRDLLGQVVRTGGPPGGPAFVPVDLRPLLDDAWPGVDADLRALSARVRVATDAELDRHGLRGAQLHFKLAVIDRLWERFRGAAGNRALKWLKKLLKAIDNLLDSLRAILNVGDMAKELKTAIEDILEELQEDDSD
jgi:hypothetical protein